MKRGADIDKWIFNLFKENPEQGFKTLFDTYHMHLCVYALQLTDSFAMAEDIVQDLLVSFWEHKYYKHITGSLRSYLFTSVHNSCIAQLKKKAPLLLDELTELPVAVPPDTSFELEDLQIQEQQLKSKLEKLPPQQYLAIEELILKNRKYAEVAAELNISVNTLKTHLARGLKKLREEYNLILLLLL